jgi:RNA polymerase sigma-70 factor (ECF subfamily)
MDRTDDILIRALKNGEPAAYRQLFDRHYVLLCKVAFGFLRDKHLSETIVSNVMVYLWENRQTIEIKSALISYLIAAVRFNCMNYLRQKSVRAEISFSGLTQPAASYNFQSDMSATKLLSVHSDDYPPGMLLEKELEEKIAQVVNNLPEECRKVFVLSRFDGKNYDEIAAILSISVNTVKYHIKNALAGLRVALKEYLE